MTTTDALPMLPALESYEEWKRARALVESMYAWTEDIHEQTEMCANLEAVGIVPSQSQGSCYCHCLPIGHTVARVHTAGQTVDTSRFKHRARRAGRQEHRPPLAP
jgi:hypothetical protein